MMSSKMLTQLNIVQRLFTSGSRQFRLVSKASAWQADRSFCSLIHAQDSLLQRDNSFHHCATSRSRDLSKIDGMSLCSRGFSTSSRNLAKELSEKGDLVYRGAISGMIKGVKLFSLSTSVIGICLQPMLLLSNQELPTGLKFALGGIINFLVFMNPIIIHYISKKYVTELRWNRRTGIFTATTWSFFIQRREHQFTAEDVRVPDVPGMFTFLEAKGTPLFLDPHAFEDNEAYIHLMGFNKPLDWELPQQKGESENESQKR